MPLEPLESIGSRTAALSGFKGYDPKLFVNPIDGDFFCSLCSGVLRQGVVINGDPCGSIFCDFCLHERLNVRMVCPKDGRPLVLDDVFPLDIVNTKIKKLQVRCCIAPTRCTVTGEIGEHEEFWRAHEPVCDFVPLECKFCHELHLRRDHERHETHECVQRLITCVACQRHDIRAMDMDTHLLTCPEFETNRLRYDFKRMQQIMSDMQNDLLKNQEALRQCELARKADARIAAEATRTESEARAREVKRVEQLLADEAAARQAEDGAIIAALRRQYDELVGENKVLHAKIEEADLRLQQAIAPKADKDYCDANFAQIIADFKAEDVRLHARIDKCEVEYRANHERIQEVVRTIDAETKSLILDLDIKQRRIVEEIRIEVVERKAEVVRVEDLIRQADSERRMADDRLDEAIRRADIEARAETQKVVVELRHHVSVLRDETLKAVAPYFPAIAQLRTEVLAADEQLGAEIRQETQERIVADEETRASIQKVDAEHTAEEQRLAIDTRRLEAVVHEHNAERKVDVSRLEMATDAVDQRRAADAVSAETARAATETELKEEIDVLRVQTNEVELATTLMRKEDQAEFRALFAQLPPQIQAVDQARQADVKRLDLADRNEIDARKEEVTRVEGVIRKHYFEHKATEQELDTFQKNVAAALAKECAQRQTDDEALSVRIADEVHTRTVADEALSARITKEVEERIAEIHPFYQLNADRVAEIAALDVRLVAEGEVFRAEDARLAAVVAEQDAAQRQATLDVNSALQQTNYALSVADAERRADTQRIEAAAQKAELERRADAYRFTEAVRLSEVERRALDERLCESIKEIDVRYQAEDRRLQAAIDVAVRTESDFELEVRKEVNRLDAAIGGVEAARMAEDARLEVQHVALVATVARTDAAAVALEARVTASEGEIVQLHATDARLDEELKAESATRAEADADQMAAHADEVATRVREVSRLDDEDAVDKAERLEKEARVEEIRVQTDASNNSRFHEITVEQTRIMENFRASEIERKVTATRMLQSLSQQEADRKASETRILDDLRRSDLERKEGELRTSQALRSLEVERRADVERNADAFRTAEHARNEDAIRAEEALRAARNELKNELLALSVAEQRTAEALRAAEFERKAAAERLAEDWRHAEVERRADADTAAEHVRAVEKAAKGDHERLAEDVRRFTVEVRAGLTEAQHETRKCTETVRQAEADRKADVETMNALLLKQQTQQKGEVPLLQSQLKKTAERLLQEENDRKADTERSTAAIAKTEHTFDEFRQLFNERLEQLERGVTSAHASTVKSMGVTIKAPSDGEARPSSSSNKSSALLAAEQAAVPKGGRYHNGQWRKHRLLEYWSCCQTPSTGDKNANGCQIKQ